MQFLIFIVALIGWIFGVYFLNEILRQAVNQLFKSGIRPIAPLIFWGYVLSLVFILKFQFDLNPLVSGGALLLAICVYSFRYVSIAVPLKLRQIVQNFKK